MKLFWRFRALTPLFAVLAVFFVQVACDSSSIAESSSTLEDRIKGAFFGALVSDALCLGSHYEYDAPKIQNAYQEADGSFLPKYRAPGEGMGGETHGVGWGQRNYHPGTKAGDNTDYGEYNILILEHVAQTGENFELKSFLPFWFKSFTSGNWKQWVCTQTKQALQKFHRGSPAEQLGGNSNAMALRFGGILPLLATQNLSEEQFLKMARDTMFTHQERTALMGNQFFARIVFQLIQNRDFDDMDGPQRLKRVIDLVTETSDPWIKAKVQQAKQKVEEVLDPSSDLSKEKYADDLALTSMARLWDVGKSEPIRVGKASPTEGTLPGSLYFILKYSEKDEMVQAFQGNAMVGGDNASRSVAIGLVLGALHGIEAIPQNLISELNAGDKCQQMIDSILSRKQLNDEL